MADNRIEQIMKVHCDVCGKTLYRLASWALRGRHNFCSRKCKIKGQSKHIVEDKDLFCETCDIKLNHRPPRRVANAKHYFCSVRCRGQWDSKNLIGEKANRYGKTSKVKKRTDFTNPWQESPRF